MNNLSDFANFGELQIFFEGGRRGGGAPPQKKNVIHQNLRNRLKYSQNLAIKNKSNF